MDLWIKVVWVIITSYGQFDLWIKVCWVKIKICQSGFVAQVGDVVTGPFVVKSCLIPVIKRIMVLPYVLLLSHVIHHIKSFFFFFFLQIVFVFLKMKIESAELPLQDKGIIHYTRPFDILKKEDRGEIFEFMYWLGCIQNRFD